MKILVLLSIPMVFYSQNLKTIYTEEAYRQHPMGEYDGICTMNSEYYSASSFLKSQGSNNYAPSNLFDYDTSTAWVEGKSGYGIGEKIIIEDFVPNSIVNGYTKSSKSFYDNSRVKTFKVYRNGRPICYLRLEDTMKRQSFELPFDNWDGQFIFEIIDVYPGRKWKDTAISDMNSMGCCMADDTKIGLKNISSINDISNDSETDILLSDFKTVIKSGVSKTVRTTHMKLIEISTSNHKIKITPNHPLYFKEYGFKSLRDMLKIKSLNNFNDLENQLEVLVWDNENNKVEFSTIKTLNEIKGKFETYNVLEIVDGEMYFANGFLQKTYGN